jgi:hypothetical protein
MATLGKLLLCVITFLRFSIQPQILTSYYALDFAPLAF